MATEKLYDVVCSKCANTYGDSDTYTRTVCSGIPLKEAQHRRRSDDSQRRR